MNRRKYGHFYKKLFNDDSLWECFQESWKILLAWTHSYVNYLSITIIHIFLNESWDSAVKISKLIRPWHLLQIRPYPPQKASEKFLCLRRELFALFALHTRFASRLRQPGPRRDFFFASIVRHTLEPFRMDEKKKSAFFFGKKSFMLRRREGA